MRCYINAFRNYANSDGRATRKEFLLYWLFHSIFISCFSFIDGYLGLCTADLSYGLFSTVYVLIGVCPSICLFIRRLHDVGKSGNYWFLGLIPILNLYVLYLLIKRGDPKINKYGPPHGVAIPQGQYQKQETNMGTFIVDQSTGEVVSEIARARQSIQSEQIRFCRICGCALLEDSNFCVACGTRVVKEW